jgi:hypothetical protein
MPSDTSGWPPLKKEIERSSSRWKDNNRMAVKYTVSEAEEDFS